MTISRRGLLELFLTAPFARWFRKDAPATLGVTNVGTFAASEFDWRTAPFMFKGHPAIWDDDLFAAPLSAPGVPLTYARSMMERP